MKWEKNSLDWWNSPEFADKAYWCGLRLGQARQFYLMLAAGFGRRGGLWDLELLARLLGARKQGLLKFARELALFELGIFREADAGKAGECEEAGKEGAKEDGERLLDVKELAARLKLSVPTLYSWRCLGKGPASVKVGFKIRYRQADVDRWLEANRICPGWPAV